MSVLSAPNIWEPLYECAPQVVVTGYVPGATIDIYAIPPGPGSPVRIGGGVSFSATGQVFGVNVSLMVLDTRVYATQTYGGNTSPPSPEIILQGALSVSPPRLAEPLLDCARCVYVDGMLPGATGEVLDAVTSLGKRAAYSGGAHIGVSPPLETSHTITARQVYCGTPGPESPGLDVVSVSKHQETLPEPYVNEPLYACQQYVTVGGCLPGAQVELFIDTIPIAGACASRTGATVWVSGGLIKNTAVTVQQKLCGGSLESPISIPPVIVQPADDIPRPAIRNPLYEGDTGIVVAMTVSGETVTIEADGTQIGMGGAGGGDAPLNVDPPLVAGQHVVASVELCGVKKDSLPVGVRSRPAFIPPPRISEPLHACSAELHVTGCLPGAKVRVYASAGSTVLIGVAQTFAGSITIGVTPHLLAGWKITATQEVGGATSDSSDGVEVIKPPAPPAPRLPKIIYECARCIRVKDVQPGARVNVYQNDIWIGGADTWGTWVNVGVFPSLTKDATITARQTVCEKTSEPAMGRVSAAPKELPAPTLEEAYAGNSYVVAGNLVPGAILEIEEISVYSLVIGIACASDTNQSIWLSLPLFAGARLRARQRLCNPGPYSPTVDVRQPREWPLGEGPFKAGFQVVTNIPISSEVSDFEPAPDENNAIIFYPATEDGEGTPVASSGPFQMIVFGHARRSSSAAVCIGAPTDTTQDFRQLSDIFAHLARWGFVTISPDLSWVTGFIFPRRLLLEGAVSYVLAENSRAGSPFNGKIATTGIGAMGHSTGGLTAIYLGTSGALSIDVMGLIAPLALDMNDIAEIVGFAPKPVLLLHGTEDTGMCGVDGLPLSIYAAASTTKHLVTIGGANHFGYTDALCIDPPCDGAATISRTDQQKIAKAYLTALFRRHLNGITEMDDYLSGVRPVEELETLTITVDSA